MAEQPNPIADNLLARLPVSPDIYPQKIDLVLGAVLLVRFDAAAYRAASFLDDRILRPDMQGAWLPMDRVDEAARHVTNPCSLHFVFHTGHVGSTLLCRLLDAAGDVLSLREPLPLRTLADAHDVLGRPESLLGEPQFAQVLGMFTHLWRRGYGATRSVVVKATSSAGRMAHALLAQGEESRAVYLNLRAEPYLATLLAGQNSPADLRGHGPGRIRRLQARISVSLTPLHALSLGELAAMSWLAESWAQDDALARHPGRVIALDFGEFLADVEAGMGRVLAHFALAHDAQQLSALAESPVLTQYSKAPEFAYTPSTRRHVLDESRRAHHEEIRKGMAWLDRIAQADPAAAAVLQRAEHRETTSTVR